MSYYDRSNTQLKVVLCANLACTSINRVIVDSTNNVGQYSSITTTVSFGIHFLAISYFDASTSDLKVVFCDEAFCSSPTVFTVASTGVVGKWTSIAVGLGNFSRVVIAYMDEQLNAVRLAFCGISFCSSPTFATVEALGTDTADGISLAIGTHGAPVLSYYRRSAPTTAARRIAVCDDANCTAPVIRALGSGSFVEQQSGIAVAPDGLPVAAFGGQSSTTCDTSGGGSVRPCSSAWMPPVRPVPSRVSEAASRLRRQSPSVDAW